MAQSRLGVTHVLEDQMHLLTVAILKFIQLMLPLPPLSPMAQSRLGVTQILKEQTHPLTVAISKFIQPVLHVVCFIDS
jgi:heme/copper-type cytochrome/quinol oxidase subunit 4